MSGQWPRAFYIGAVEVEKEGAPAEPKRSEVGEDVGGVGRGRADSNLYRHGSGARP